MKPLSLLIRKASLLFLLCFLLNSCSTYKRTVETPSGTQIQKIKLYTAWVFLENGKKLKGLLYTADLKQITLAKNQHFNKDEFVVVNASEIEKIKLNKKGYMGRSVLTGFVSGALVGAALGYSRGDDSGSRGILDYSHTKEEKAAINSLVFSIVGAHVGLIFGTAKKTIVINGDSTVYESNLGNIQSYAVVKDF